MSRRLRLVRLGFPFTRPTWPGGVPRPPVRRTTGIDYDTRWARTAPARAVRALVLDGVTRPLVRAVADPTVAGLDRIEDLAGPVIFAPNHTSHVDTALVLTSLPQRLRHRTAVAAAADYFFDRRWKGALWALAVNAVPVERVRASPQSTRLARELLADGWSLVIYPEGGRSVDGWGQEHRPGPAWLSIRNEVPVVPVHVEGTRRVLRKGARAVRPARTSVTFGRALRARPGEDAREFTARIERAIAELADEQANGWWRARRRAAAGGTPSLTGPDAGAWRRSWALGEGRRRESRPSWPPADGRRARRAGRRVT